MNAGRIAIVLVAVLAVLSLAVPAASEPDDNIIISGADVILEPLISASSPPIDVTTRVVVAYSNEVRRVALVAMPVAPPVPERVVVEYANEILREPLPALPAALTAALNQITDRIVIQYANANLHFNLDYPVDLIDDLRPPTIPTPPDAIIVSGSTVSITWTTDEFADSEVLYGVQSGQYTETASDPLFVKEHEIGLTGLTPETTYYYQARSTDLSGNTTTSTERSFTTVVPNTNLSIYLPLVIRNSP